MTQTMATLMSSNSKPVKPETTNRLRRWSSANELFLVIRPRLERWINKKAYWFSEDALSIAQLAIVEKWQELETSTIPEALSVAKNVILSELKGEFRCFRSGLSEQRKPIRESDSLLAPASTTVELFLDDCCRNERERDIALALIKGEKAWDIARRHKIAYATFQQIRALLQQRFQDANS